MGFADAVVNSMQLYATFTGRAARREYWFFFLFQFLIYLATIILMHLQPVAAYLLWVEIAIFLLPTVALSVRRVHDIEKSGWWICFLLIPVVGWVWYLIWMATEGMAGVNGYGADPAP